MSAELGRENSVISRGTAAAQNMPGNDRSGFKPRFNLNFLGDTSGRGGFAAVGAELSALLFLELCLLNVIAALRYGENGERLACVRAALTSLRHFIYIIGDLGQQNNIRAACQTAVQREPACFVAHYLYAHNTAV